MVAKSTQTITPLTADGSSEEIDLSVKDLADFNIKHTNSGGEAITLPATVTLEIQGTGVTTWRKYQKIIFSNVEDAVEEITMIIPSTAAKARLSYTIPGQGGSPQLEAECNMAAYESP